MRSDFCFKETSYRVMPKENKLCSASFYNKRDDKYINGGTLILILTLKSADCTFLLDRVV